ncbi:MAG: HK97 family phage prohead protease [bacterium]|jgi:HK97 family phage prohead protease
MKTKELGIQTCKALVKDIGGEPGERGWIIGVASTSTVDRDGDVIEAAGWLLDEYRKNPQFLFAHDASDLPIGKTLWVKPEDKQLIFKAEFAAHQKAQDVRRLYLDGMLNSFSVRFLPVEYTIMENGGYRFEKQKLVEISAVPIPANAEAVVVEVKSGTINTDRDTLRRLEVMRRVKGGLLGRLVAASEKGALKFSEVKHEVD